MRYDQEYTRYCELDKELRDKIPNVATRHNVIRDKIDNEKRLEEKQWQK